MPIKVFGSTLFNTENKTDTSLFVQKYEVRTNYQEFNFKEDIDMKNQFRIKILLNPISI